MIEMNDAIFGAGETCVQSSALDGEGLLSALEHQINYAGSPMLAMQLMEQRRFLEERLQYKKWLMSVAAQREPSVGVSMQHNATHHLLRRAQAAVLM